MITRDQDQPVEELIMRLRKSCGNVETLQEILATRARLQEYTERQFNELVQVAKEGIAFLDKVREGDVIRQDWLDERDQLVERALRLIADS